MRLLVLGGTHHVGRGVVEAALRRGDDVTTVTRGLSGPPADGALPLYVDRMDRAALLDALGTSGWDVVLDTWSGPPLAVHHSAELLGDRVAHYVYVSSRSVYRWPLPLDSDESAPLVDGDPRSDDDSDYAAAKRGGEIAVQQVYGERALLARAGLILGPYERVGRLPWWLNRIARGGRVLAPGPKDRPLQYVDGRDLATWMLSAADRRVAGAFNVVSRQGHTTIGELLEACVETTGAGPSWCGRRPRSSSRPGCPAGPSCRSGCRRRASSPACTRATFRRPTRRGSAASRSAKPCATPGIGCRTRGCQRSLPTGGLRASILSGSRRSSPPPYDGAAVKGRCGARTPCQGTGRRTLGES